MADNPRHQEYPEPIQNESDIEYILDNPAEYIESLNTALSAKINPVIAAIQPPPHTPLRTIKRVSFQLNFDDLIPPPVPMSNPIRSVFKRVQRWRLPWRRVSTPKSSSPSPKPSRQSEVKVDVTNLNNTTAPTTYTSRVADIPPLMPTSLTKENSKERVSSTLPEIPLSQKHRTFMDAGPKLNTTTDMQIDTRLKIRENRIQDVIKKRKKGNIT